MFLVVAVVQRSLNLNWCLHRAWCLVGYNIHLHAHQPLRTHSSYRYFRLSSSTLPFDAYVISMDGHTDRLASFQQSYAASGTEKRLLWLQALLLPRRLRSLNPHHSAPQPNHRPSCSACAG